MKRVIEKIREGWKKIGKYIVGVVGVGALLSQILLPAAGLEANQPRFNFLSGDHELLKGVNISAGGSVRKDPISGSAGDTIEVAAYYHNGVPKTVAKNTKLFVDIPTETTNSQVWIEAAFTADNAETAYDTIVDGQIVGYSGLTINLDKDATLELIQGSVKWYPEVKSGVGEAQLPNGQNGSEFLTKAGLNLGNIKGCWDYAGFVTFQIQTIAKTTPDPEPEPNPEPGILKNEKVVREHIHNVDNPYEKEISVNADTHVGFDIRIWNEGENDLTNVIATDNMPSELSVDEGTLVFVKNGLSTPLSTDLFTTGVNIGTIKAGEKVRIHYRATSPSEITNAVRVVNSTTAKSGDQKVWSRAWVNLIPGTVSIDKSKSAFNLSKNVDAESVKAQAGDEIVYTLVTGNVGDLSTNVVVEDEINDILEYADVVAISDGGYLDDYGWIVWPEENLLAGYSFTDTFTVKVKNPIPENEPDGYHYDLVMWNLYGNEVIIDIEKPKPKPPIVVNNPILTIEKRVRNITANELEFVNANTAYAADTLEYRIDFRNTGDGVAFNLVLTDVLPANVTVDGSFAPVLYRGDMDQPSVISVTNGVTLDSLAAGANGHLIFRVVIASGVVGGERLVNKAIITSGDILISDTAETVIIDKIVPIEFKPELKPTPLPKTGSNVVLMLIVALVGSGVVIVVREYRRAKSGR